MIGQSEMPVYDYRLKPPIRKSLNETQKITNILFYTIFIMVYISFIE